MFTGQIQTTGCSSMVDQWPEFVIWNPLSPLEMEHSFWSWMLDRLCKSAQKILSIYLAGLAWQTRISKSCCCIQHKLQQQKQQQQKIIAFHFWNIIAGWGYRIGSCGFHSRVAHSLPKCTLVLVPKSTEKGNLFNLLHGSRSGLKSLTILMCVCV